MICLFKSIIIVELYIFEDQLQGDMDYVNCFCGMSHLLLE